jgi:hypothetical protein
MCGAPVFLDIGENATPFLAYVIQQRLIYSFEFITLSIETQLDTGNHIREEYLVYSCLV